MEYKKCKECKNILPLKYFYNSKYTQDGKMSKCSICHNKQVNKIKKN